VRVGLWRSSTTLRAAVCVCRVWTTARRNHVGATCASETPDDLTGTVWRCAKSYLAFAARKDNGRVVEV